MQVNLQVINRELYEIGSRNPKANGVLDKRMGVSRPDSDNLCSSCEKRLSECPGHFWLHSSNLPCFHIGYFKQPLTFCIAYVKHAVEFC